MFNVLQEKLMKSEIILIARPGAGIKIKNNSLVSNANFDVSLFNEMLAKNGVAIEPLFGVNEEQLLAEIGFYESQGVAIPNLSVFYRIEVPPSHAEEIFQALSSMNFIENVYVKPPAEPAWLDIPDTNMKADDATYVPDITPDFSVHQIYLEEAPIGVDAKYAWGIIGGNGSGITLADIESGWNFSHEDLVHNKLGVIYGSNADNPNDRIHGTDVIGVLGGDNNEIGIKGICHGASIAAIAVTDNDYINTSKAIKWAADYLKPGDILILELHRAGPRYPKNPKNPRTQYGYIPIEWWPCDYAAIQYATAKNIIVVEAAGNGGQSLDDDIYSQPPENSCGPWKNPFNIENLGSGAVIVGAGSVQAGTHGRNISLFSNEPHEDRARCFFSNYGKRIDTQAYGVEVTTTGDFGYPGYELQKGDDPNRWYTNGFPGTSSATPIVAGVIACVQGIIIANKKEPLTPAQVRNLLRSTGSPQEDGLSFDLPAHYADFGSKYPRRAKSQRIGTRPNLKELVPAALNITETPT